MAKEKAASKAVARKNRQRKGIRKFFREVVSEVKKVSWPNAKDLTNHTLVVVVLILLFAIVIGIVDFGLGKLFTLIS